MAKKFFYNKVEKNRTKTLLLIGIIAAAIIILIILIVVIAKLVGGKTYTCDDHVAKTKEFVRVDINSELPNKSDYFTELKCVNEKHIKVDTKSVDISKFGEYTAHIKIAKESHDVKIIVGDTKAPKLVAKSAKVLPGTAYTYDIFVDSCSDNSKEDCSIDFYKGAVDKRGIPIDYASYREIGTYEIKLSAKDSHGNQSIVTTTLEISSDADSSGSAPQGCKYGNLSYKSEYTLALKLNNNGCALSEEEIKAEANKEIATMADEETTKIKSEVNKIEGLTKNLSLKKNIFYVPNVEEKGFVGFALQIIITDENNKDIARYYLDEDKTRVFETNPYNLK